MHNRGRRRGWATRREEELSRWWVDNAGSDSAFYKGKLERKFLVGQGGAAANFLSYRTAPHTTPPHAMGQGQHF